MTRVCVFQEWYGRCTRSAAWSVCTARRRGPTTRGPDWRRTRPSPRDSRPPSSQTAWRRSPWGKRESRVTEWVGSHFRFLLKCVSNTTTLLQLLLSEQTGSSPTATLRTKWERISWPSPQSIMGYRSMWRRPARPAIWAWRAAVTSWSRNVHPRNSQASMEFL